MTVDADRSLFLNPDHERVVVGTAGQPFSQAIVKPAGRQQLCQLGLPHNIGATPEDFERIKPLLKTFASDLTLCGGVGTGQVVKILNNMVLFETVVAISEAKAIGERAGVDPALLFDAMSKGSGDSFALRNHGMKAILLDKFPERAFSVEYARKDLAYALRLAADTGVDARGARTVDTWFAEAIDAGEGDQYHPVVSKRIGSTRLR